MPLFCPLNPFGQLLRRAAWVRACEGLRAEAEVWRKARQTDPIMAHGVEGLLGILLGEEPSLRDAVEVRASSADSLPVGCLLLLSIFSHHFVLSCDALTTISVSTALSCL